MYLQIEIVELEMEALLEARDIYTTRRPVFSACGVGCESGGRTGVKCSSNHNSTPLPI